MTGGDIAKGLLNPSQTNSLRISLMPIEKGLLEVERVLSDGEHDGIFFRVSDDLREETKTGIRALIEEIRAVLREMKDRFHLSREINDTSRAVFGKVPALWEISAGTKASRLRGYGEVNPRLKDLLDPSVERVSRLLLGMENLVSRSR
jgi:hypothetical protein